MAAAEETTMVDLARLLRQLRRREARSRGGAELTYRELAAKTGWSHATIGEYFTGRALPPTERFDVLIMLLGATPAEQGALATARDRIEDARRSTGGRTRAPAPPAAPADGPLPGIPRELPNDVTRFVGRDAQLAELDHLLRAARSESTVIITALSGAGGVGKTALALRWAHRVADRFPDGQLYVNLRGYDPEEPMPATDALASFLRSLGHDAASIPTDPAERAARYRTLLADRRLLVVLDNARDAEHVRPLLPGSPTCLALITSRNPLPGLVARDGAHRLLLSTLARDESRSLLRNLIGHRVEVEEEAAAELADQCGRLPLALRLAAELAATNPDASLTDLAEELRDERRRLDLLDAGGDPQTAVRAVFSWSYRSLTAPAAEAFRLLGLHPGTEFDAYALAALAGADLPTAQRLLGELLRAHLVQQPQRLRYTMHDLLRAYAAEQANQQLHPSTRRAGLTGLFDYYRQAAAVASIGVFPHHPPARHWYDQPHDVTLPPLDGAARARAWLDQERANLVAVSGHAAGHGWPHHAIDLSQILYPYLATQYDADALAVHTSAESAAREPGRLRAGVVTCLGNAYWRLGRTDQAVKLLQEALTNHHAADAGDAQDADARDRAVTERVTRTVLADILDGTGRFREALAHCEASLAIAQASGDRGAEAKQLSRVGLALQRLERYPEAADHFERAASLAREGGLRRVETYAAHGLGLAFLGLDRLAEALTQLDAALLSLNELADRTFEPDIRDTIGVVLRRLGRYPEAVTQLERAIAITEEIGDRRVRAQALNTLGETLSAMGQPGPARARHEQALVLAGALGDEPELDRARAGLAALD